MLYYSKQRLPSQILVFLKQHPAHYKYLQPLHYLYRRPQVLMKGTFRDIAFLLPNFPFNFDKLLYYAAKKQYFQYEALDSSPELEELFYSKHLP